MSEEYDLNASRTFEFNMTAEMMLPAPCPWWKRLWLKLRRKPLPTIQPEGTQPVTFDTVRDDGTQVRYFFPAARINWQDAGWTDDTGGPTATGDGTLGGSA